MSQQGSISIVSDTRYREHVGPDGHPERPERLLGVDRALRAFSGQIDQSAPREASDEELLRVHSADHLGLLRSAVPQAPIKLDPDTYFSPRSLEVARLAAGGTTELALRVARGEARTGLAAVRPPGHHAETDRAMGFCLLNNVAIAARAVQATCGVDKLLILDWDVHHGNGTQHTFDDDPSVLYVSTHQFPFYPGTGNFGECGEGRGTGCTVNIPLPAGCGDDEYIGALQRVLVPVATAFAPEMILVSCGFDAHRDDPLASMEVTASGYLALTRIVRALADTLCGGRLVFVLEGGYAISGIEEGTTAVLEALLEPAGAALPDAAPAAPGSSLRHALDRVAAVHGARYPGTGAA